MPDKKLLKREWGEKKKLLTLCQVNGHLLLRTANL